MKKIIYIVLFTFCRTLAAQTISGYCPQALSMQIKLIGFEGLSEKKLAETTTDNMGRFRLNYPKDYIGVSVLQVEQMASLVLLLNKEDIVFSWTNLQDAFSLILEYSLENQAFEQGVKTFQTANQKLSGLNYLLPLYDEDSEMKKTLNNEILNQSSAFDNYIKSLPKNSYVSYYLQLRKFLAQLSEKDLAPTTKILLKQTYSEMDFNDEKLWNSGLLKELLESYYKMMFSEGNDTLVTVNINQASDVWLHGLKDNGHKQEMAEFVFKMLEQFRLTQSAEHLALSMLNQSNCQLDSKRSNLFEQYRKLAIARVAPNIQLGNQLDLKGIGSRYKLLVFGASWCPNCQSDYPSLMGVYNRNKMKHGLEVIYISLDSDIEAYSNYYKEASFITYCDGKSWETQAAKDYFVCATPTYILLDTELTILAKFQTPQEIDAWLNQW